MSGAPSATLRKLCRSPAGGAVTMGSGRGGGNEAGVADFLREVALFAPLDDALRAEIAAAADVVHLAAGEYLFHAGDTGDALFAVLSGRLQVVGTSSGPTVGLGRGAAIGELALLTGETRSASVRAVRDSELLEIDRERFHELLSANSEFAVALTAVLGRRLASTARTPAAEPEARSVLAVVSLSPAVPLEAMVARLLRTVGSWAQVGQLTEGQVADVSGTEPGRSLDRCEDANDIVVLPVGVLADPAWREFCVRQADRLLVVVDPLDSPAGHDLDRLNGADLAFWHPSPPSVARSRPWLDAARPRARHWLPSRSVAEGVERMARRIFGRSTGVVLSGGGARGLAHIGAVAALREAGMTVDRYGGASMGAFVSALFASGRDAREVTEVLRHELVRRRPFADYTVPRHALIRSTRARHMFNRVFGDLHVEELPYDWFGMTSDLLTAEPLVHRRGPLRHIIGASMSLPGLAPPLRWGGRLLVDGGVLNNLPVDVMDETREGPVVAVEVMRRWKETWEQRVADAQDRSHSGTAQVPLPSIVETIACATGLGSWRSVEAARETAWLTVTPALPALGLLDWGRIDEAVAEGRRAAQQALETVGSLPDGVLTLGGSPRLIAGAGATGNSTR
jgi:NTE family protein